MALSSGLHIDRVAVAHIRLSDEAMRSLRTVGDLYGSENRFVGEKREVVGRAANLAVGANLPLGGLPRLAGRRKPSSESDFDSGGPPRVAT